MLNASAADGGLSRTVVVRGDGRETDDDDGDGDDEEEDEEENPVSASPAPRSAASASWSTLSSLREPSPPPAPRPTGGPVAEASSMPSSSPLAGLFSAALGSVRPSGAPQHADRPPASVTSSRSRRLQGDLRYVFVLSPDRRLRRGGAGSDAPCCQVCQRVIAPRTVMCQVRIHTVPDPPPPPPPPVLPM